MENFNSKKRSDGEFGARAATPKKISGGAGPNKSGTGTPPAAPTTPATVQPPKTNKD